MNLHLITFLILYTVGLILTITIDISWGLALYELIYFIFPVNRWWYTLPRFRYTFLLGIILIILFIAKKKNFTNLGSSLYPLAKWLLLMIGLMLIISFYAVWPDQHFRFLEIQIKQLVFIYIAYNSIDTDDKFERLTWAFIIGSFYIAYIATGMPRNSFGRIEGIGMPDGRDSNTTAAVLVTAIPLLCDYIMRGNITKKIISLLMITYIFNGVILLNSRGAVLALGACLAYFTFQLLRKKMIPLNQKMIIAILLIGTVSIFLYLADPTFWSRMSTLETVKAGQGGATRTNFWMAAWNLAKQRPFGVGARGFEFLSPNILPAIWLSKTGTRAIHSLYFEALAEFGYPGLILLAGFIGTTFHNLYRVSQRAIERDNIDKFIRATALQSAFIGFLVSSIFLNRLYAEDFYWLMLFAAIQYKLYVHPIRGISN